MIISYAVATKGSTVICHLRESTDPNAQLNDENSSVVAQTSCIIPRVSRYSNFGQNNTAMPQMPSRTPLTPRRDRRSPRKTNASSNTNQIGVTAMIKAANPVGTYCSAQASPPLPPTSNMQPMIASFPNCSRVTRILRRIIAQAANMTGPAIRKRMEHMTNGGRCSSSAMPMAR